jgi:hypothetical protein
MLSLFTSFMRLPVAVFLDFGPPFPLSLLSFPPSSCTICPPSLHRHVLHLGIGRCSIYTTPLLETVTLDMEIDAIIIHVQYLHNMDFI